jgi:hypothetical protein
MKTLLYLSEDPEEPFRVTVFLNCGMLILFKKGKKRRGTHLYYHSEERAIILPENVTKVCAVLLTDASKVLQDLKRKFNTRSCYEDVLSTLKDYRIPFQDKFPKPSNTPASVELILFHRKAEIEEIRVSVSFVGDDLYISKYVYDPALHTHWGCYDHTWNNKVQHNAIENLYLLMEVPVYDRQTLLSSLAEKFDSPESFEQIEKFFQENEIEFERGPGPISWF